MSDVTIDAAVIKRTQDTLGKYVKKPVLSEKLLKKPPFRFLHDVFNAVIRDTGCFNGLYTADELNFENINSRDAKMHFLQKMIDTIKIATNEPLTVKSSKIVAGHEPDKTNELLQLMGIVIENGIDWKKSVEMVNNSGVSSVSKSKSQGKESKVKKSTDKKSESPKDKTKTAEAKEKLKSKDSKDSKDNTSKKHSKSTDAEKKEEKKREKKSSSKESLKKPSPEKVKKPAAEPAKVKSEPKVELMPEQITEKPNEDKKIVDDNPMQTEIKNENKTENESPSSEYNRDERRASKRAEEILLLAAAEDTTGPESRRSSGSKRSSGRSRRDTAEKSRNSRPDEANTKIHSEPPESLKTVTEEHTSGVMASPTMKSPPSPESMQNSEVKRESTFVRKNSNEDAPNHPRPRTSLRPPSARPASARPGAPRRRDKNIEIILQPNDQVKLSGISVKLETFTSELEDDGENLVIIENPNTEDPLQETISNNNRVADDESLQQGHLVQQILETQKELVQSGPTDTEPKQDNDMSKLNSRQSSARQMNNLRDVIQNLTKSVNPLGKLMDFIPEDIDAMQLELTVWRDTYNQSSVELKKERSLTESVTEPMKNQLVTIESTIKEYHEMIDGCRAKILQNAEKIQRLLTTQ